MARRGPKPKPTRLKALNGNPGHRPLNDQEPQPTQGVPPCPDFLDDVAKETWHLTVPELSRLGMLTLVDGHALAGYCQAWAEFEDATRTLKAEGRTFRSKNGFLIAHPAVAAQRNAMNQIRAFASLFGFDPSSRSRLKVAPDQGQPDALDRLLKSKRNDASA